MLENDAQTEENRGNYSLYIYIYIYIYIKWTVFVNVTTKSAQHAHARMIAIIVEKSPNSSHMYDHGFMDNTNRQAVKNWLDSQTRDASLTSWRQPFCKWFTKWLPPWRKGRISCLWIKSVFDCLTIGIIHETMVVHMTWVWTFFNNYIYIYIYIYIYTPKVPIHNSIDRPYKHNADRNFCQSIFMILQVTLSSDGSVCRIRDLWYHVIRLNTANIYNTTRRVQNGTMVRYGELSIHHGQVAKRVLSVHVIFVL